MQRQIAEFHNLNGVKISEEILAVKTFDDLVLTHSKMTIGDQTFFQTTMQRVVDGKIVEHWPWTVLGLDAMK
jgi:predicted SnoaL-like aldol condensation-catalyzing enzyme